MSCERRRTLRLPGANPTAPQSGPGQGLSLEAMASTPDTKITKLSEMLARLEDQVRRMHDDLDSRVDAIASSLEARGADEEAEALAAERVRSGAAERTQDGTQALAELGIHTH